MSCDGFADKNGVFEMTISNYETSHTLRVVTITGLIPYNKIDFEITKGNADFAGEICPKCNIGKPCPNETKDGYICQDCYESQADATYERERERQWNFERKGDEVDTDE